MIKRSQFSQISRNLKESHIKFMREGAPSSHLVPLISLQELDKNLSNLKINRAEALALFDQWAGEECRRLPTVFVYDPYSQTTIQCQRTSIYTKWGFISHIIRHFETYE